MENLNSLIWSDEDSINTSIDPRPMQEKCLCGFCTIAPGPGEGGGPGPTDGAGLLTGFACTGATSTPQLSACN